MLRKLKPFFSVFFLAIFLFPAIVQEVHTISHEMKFHCDAIGEQHIHEQHHNCDLCDFVIPVVSVSSSLQTQFSLTHFAEYIFPCQIEICFPAYQFSSALLRAPPFVS